MRLITAVLIIFLSYGYSRGFDEELIGLPIELEGDIWPSIERQHDEQNWEETLARLCRNVDLTLNDEIVDCDSLEIIPKSLKIDKHEIRKREAEATELEEGSGGEPAEPILAEPVPAEPALAEPVPAEPAPAEHELTEPVPAESVPAETVPVEPVPAETVPAEPVQAETVPTEPVPAETVPTETVPAELVPAETVPAEPVPAKTVPAETVPAETVPAESVPAESVPAEPVSPESDPTVQEPVEPEPAEPIPEGPFVAEPVSEEAVPAEAVAEDKGAATPIPSNLDSSEVGKEELGSAEPVPEKPLLANQLPSETIKKTIETVSAASATAAEPELVKTSEPSAAGGLKEAEASGNGGMVGEKSGKNYVSKEYLNDKQSDNVVIDGLEGTMEETDAALNKKKFNESLKTAADEPSAGESTKQAGGGNALPIGLFAGAVAVGAAAFAYNHVRRRRRRRGQARGGAAPQDDAEAGKEMRPLMGPAGADAVAASESEKGRAVEA